MAIGIIALLLGSIFVPLQAQIESRKQEETVRILEQARDALLGYAATYGYLPCPADYGLNSNGAEAAGSDHSTGVCDSAGADSVLGGGTAGVYIGYLPAVTLGFTPTDAEVLVAGALGKMEFRWDFKRLAAQRR